MITCPLAFRVHLVHQIDLCFNRGRSKKLPPDVFVRCKKACLQIRSKLTQNVWWPVPINRWKSFAQLTRRVLCYNLLGKYYHVLRSGLRASWPWPCWNQASLRKPRFPSGARCGLSTWVVSHNRGVPSQRRGFNLHSLQPAQCQFEVALWWRSQPASPLGWLQHPAFSVENTL